MDIFSALLLLATPSLAEQGPPSVVSSFLQERSPSFEWTAWGDSYASGVGSGKYLGGRRCLRYDGAYPSQIGDDPSGLLPGQGGKFNNVVCSGSKAEEVEEFQFYDHDEHNKPNRMYDPRPASGKPTMGTLTVVGDDIDFPGILSNCIVEGFSFPLNQGFTKRPCDVQRSLSWSLICQDGNHDVPNSELVQKFDSVIKKIIAWGHGQGAEIFRLYVTGYGQFFNEDDPGCDSVTSARTANPKDDGKPHITMTRELRKDYNAMSRTLNKAIQTAVDQNQDAYVTYIDIDSLLPGHRFCEPGVTEPDQNNDNLYFWHYPYTQASADGDPNVAWLNQIAQDNANTLTWDPEKTLYRDYLNQFWDIVDSQSSTGNFTQDGVEAQYDPWPDSVGYRAKLFHPQPPFHKAIYEAIIKQYRKDASEDPDSIASTPNATSSIVPTSTTTFSPPTPALEYEPGTCTLHIDQYEIACLADDKNYQAHVVIRDNGGNIIGETEGEEDNYPSIDASDPLHM